IDWPVELAKLSAEGEVYGLEFLAGPLNYWYSKASGRNSAQIGEIDAFLKERGATASEVLAQAGKIILDFAGKHPLSPSAAWRERAVSRRARILALFVLCCKMAAKRKIRVDEAVCTQIFLELLDLIELLR